MRLPAVINYPIGERVVFRAGPHAAYFPGGMLFGRAILQHGSLKKIQTGPREQY